MDFDTFANDLFAEINDMEGEIFDIPEMQDEKKFDLEGYINGNYDYWHLGVQCSHSQSTFVIENRSRPSIGAEP